jgi:uncharacterized protein YceK
MKSRELSRNFLCALTIIFALTGCSNINNNSSSSSSNSNNNSSTQQSSSRTSANTSSKGQQTSQGTQAPSVEKQVFEAVREDSADKLNAIIKPTVSFLKNELGAKALKQALSDEIRKILVKKIYTDLGGTKQEDFNIKDILEELLKINTSKTYDEFIKTIISFRRQKISDEELLKELAYQHSLYGHMAAAGVDLNTIAAPSFGLNADSDRGPLLVMLTALHNPMEELLLARARALIEAGADVNAIDKRGHTALYYADSQSKMGHDYQRKPFIALGKYLEANGGIIK